MSRPRPVQLVRLQASIGSFLVANSLFSKVHKYKFISFFSLNSRGESIARTSHIDSHRIFVLHSTFVEANRPRQFDHTFLHPPRMSSYSGSSSRYQSSGQKPIIHYSRESSTDSRSSYESKSSSGGYYSSSSRITMGYPEEPIKRKYRDHGNEKKYIESSSRGGVEVIHQDQGRYIPSDVRGKNSSSSHSTISHSSSSKKHREHPSKRS